jgi:hypothetical protein
MLAASRRDQPIDYDSGAEILLIFDLQAYRGKLSKQPADPRLPPYLDFGIGVFLINLCEEPTNRIFGSVFLSVDAVIAEEHRDEGSTSIEAFADAWADVLRLV